MLQTINWDSWAPYLNNPKVLMGFIALLCGFVALFVFAKNPGHPTLGRNVIAGFFLIAAFVVAVAGYNSLPVPANLPPVAAEPTGMARTANAAVSDADTRSDRFTNIQIVNGSHNSVQNHVGKSQ